MMLNSSCEMDKAAELYNKPLKQLPTV